MSGDVLVENRSLNSKVPIYGPGSLQLFSPVSLSTQAKLEPCGGQEHASPLSSPGSHIYAACSCYPGELLNLLSKCLSPQPRLYYQNKDGRKNAFPYVLPTSHMTDEETEAQSLSYFPKVTLLVSGRVRIWTQVCALKCPFHHASCIP